MNGRRREKKTLDATALVAGDACLIGRFEAMGCPCEILLDTSDASIAAEQVDAAKDEARRIEQKYSRYLRGNIVDEINVSRGRAVSVDAETAGLFDYAAECYALSGGLFDITSGALRKIWRFDGTENVVSPAEVDRACERIGWDRVRWARPFITLPAGFEIDLGGICKEYAADKILALLRSRRRISTLVNLGGDIAAAGGRAWSVGIEGAADRGALPLREGGVATSGSAKRFATVKGAVVGHILNPKTGWPVQGAPQSVTVAAATCTEAGFWSTLGMLQGPRAEAFLEEQSLAFWCRRPSLSEPVKR
jgi:thiamine biosynthesis lipoprotein